MKLFANPGLALHEAPQLSLVESPPVVLVAKTD